jgi:MerR family transcriptional regulator, Zn(II)-responsive regulator of zntA
MAELLLIREAAQLAGLSTKTIRFYEEAGLIPPPSRSDGGHRLFSSSDVRRLRLVRRARLLGLPLAEVKELADLAFGESCSAFEQQLQALIERRIDDVDRTMRELTSLRAELAELGQTFADGEAGDEPCSAEGCPRCRFIDDWHEATAE